MTESLSDDEAESWIDMVNGMCVFLQNRDMNPFSKKDFVWKQEYNNHTHTYTEQIKKFEEVISSINGNIVCSMEVAFIIQDCPLFVPISPEIGKIKPNTKYIIGTYNKYDVFIDAYLKYNDINIYNEAGDVILNLKDYDIDISDLI